MLDIIRYCLQFSYFFTQIVLAFCVASKISFESLKILQCKTIRLKRFWYRNMCNLNNKLIAAFPILYSYSYGSVVTNGDPICSNAFITFPCVFECDIFTPLFVQPTTSTYISCFTSYSLSFVFHSLKTICCSINQIILLDCGGLCKFILS